MTDSESDCPCEACSPESGLFVMSEELNARVTEFGEKLGSDEERLAFFRTIIAIAALNYRFGYSHAIQENITVH